jgi:CRISPR-associated endonuclease Cas3-HD
MTEIYAYYRAVKDDGGFREIGKQTLEQHISKAIKSLNEEIKNTKIWKYYASLSNEESIDKWMKVAVILHDIGKIFYQENFKSLKGEKYLNFMGHEFLSTYLVDKFLNAWLEEDIESRIEEYKSFRWIVCGSILYHHHAMSLRGRERLYKIAICKNENEFNGIVSKILDIIQKYLPEFGSDVTQKFINDIKVLRPTKLINYTRLYLTGDLLSEIYRYVDEINEEIWRNFVKSGEFGKKMILSTNILIMADYRGSEERGEIRTKFGEVVDESIKLYREILSLL